jgi:6-phosphofructokinase 1
MTGISAGASKVFPPDYQFNDITTEDGKSKIIDITELVDKIARGFNIGKDFFMVIVSEGLSESLKKINEVYGAYTPADIIAKEIDRELQKKVDNVSVRPVVLGYVQRGGKPSHFDRLLATRLGVQAVIEIIENKDKYSGPIMVGIQNDCDDDKLKEKIISVPLSEVLSSPMHKCDKECKELLKYVTR